MSFEILSAGNLLVWFVQVALIAAAGLLLPSILRIRHPKSLLAYYQGVLVLCFALPVLQTWRNPLVLVSSSPMATSDVAPATVNNGWLWLVGILGAGAALRLGWLAVGMLKLRACRRNAKPVFPFPESIREARRITGADASFCVSNDVATPAAMGYKDPVVLFPPSFFLLDEEAQRGIACHELLHVRRNDWLTCFAESVIGAVLWFHPALRLLLARIKLTREQAVDAEVIRLTPSEPYIHALLSMAVVVPGRTLVPAAPFFTEGHLLHRMRELLSSPRRSALRLSASYASIAATMAALTWCVFVWLPLEGEAQIVEQRLVPGAPQFVTVNPGVSDAPPPVRRMILAVRAQRDIASAVVGLRDHVIEVETDAQLPRTFFFNLPAPQGAPETAENTVAFWASVGPGPQLHLQSDGVAPPPPPPPPPMPGAPGTFVAGVRALTPGRKFNAEEIEKIRSSLGADATLEVTQSPDGVIQRVIVGRRMTTQTQ